MGDRVGDSQGEGAGGNLDDLDKEMRSIVQWELEYEGFFSTNAGEPNK